MLGARMVCDEITFNESWLRVSRLPAVSLLASIDLDAGRMLLCKTVFLAEFGELAVNLSSCLEPATCRCCINLT